MAYFQAYIKSNLQAIAEYLPSVRKQCGGCLPLALTLEESIQRCTEYTEQNSIVLSLMTCEHADSFHEETFIDAWILKSLKENESTRGKYQFEEAEPMTIYLTSELRDYPLLSLNKDASEKCILLRKVTPIPLKRIIIGALSIESFHWAKDNLGDYLINIIENRSIVIKQNGNLGEVFIESDFHNMLSMLIVLETTPVMQGVVTEETMLVISDIHGDGIGKFQLRRLKSIQGGGNVPRLPRLKMPTPKPAHLLPQSVNLDEPDAGFFEDRKCEALTTLKVALLEMPFWSKNLTVHDSVADVDHQVWIAKKTMNEMGLNNGTWVRCQVNYERLRKDGKSKSGKIKLAQVYPIEEQPLLACVWRNPHIIKDEELFKDEIAYVSPVFVFNLLQRPFQDIETIMLCLERAEVGESPPSFAYEVNVSVISSPITKITKMYDLVLTEHFRTPRLVSKGDVLSIYCDWKNLDAPNTQVALDEGLPRSHVLYIKVDKVLGKEESLSYFVDARNSKLYQGEVAQSYIPSSAELFVQNSSKVKQPRSSYWLTSHPGGLEGYISKLEAALRSLLYTSSSSDVFPILLSGPAGVGKRTVVMATCRRLNLHVVDINCNEICSDTTGATEARMRNSFQKAFTCAPCVMLLSNIHCLGKDKDNHDKEPRIITTLMINLQEIQKVSQYPVLVLGTTSNIQNMTSDLRSCFSDEFEIDAPGEGQRVEMLKALSTGFLVGPGVSFKTLASRTAGMVLSDFCTMFSEAVLQAKDDIMGYLKEVQLIPPNGDAQSWGYRNQLIEMQKDVCSAGILLHQNHFDKAIQVLQAAHADSIGAPKIPNVCWKDIGGLSNVKQEIMDTIQLPFQYPELFAAGMQRSGILLYGPPGTGKTLVAKAVATECSLNFLSVKGPELINMYVGQSEENVREIFATASRAAPCVIFFDELDSLAPNRGRSGDSGGVMDRVVSQLLAELDGLKRSHDVFVIGATNRPDLLDPALLRPGRFDKLLYLGISKAKEDRMKIMKALTRKFNLPEEISLGDLVDMCPENLTGADFYALCSNALLNAIKRQILKQDAGTAKAELTQQDFELAIENLVPSVSNEELRHYEKIQWEFNKNKQAEKDVHIGELEIDGKETDL
ncbi:peroxisome assembly factor 2-like [Dendronephthya gigantea]|uniref:peroxisome assembly factor 2-like n=1 Tax=Dendronephthya gigantea TaxID=151771 RepID=UPI00106CDDF5|nr:peroxisome assembly factor 2-like [Dendronephthya gigantea]